MTNYTVGDIIKVVLLDNGEKIAIKTSSPQVGDSSISDIIYGGNKSEIHSGNMSIGDGVLVRCIGNGTKLAYNGGDVATNKMWYWHPKCFGYGSKYYTAFCVCAACTESILGLYIVQINQNTGDVIKIYHIKYINGFADRVMIYDDTVRKDLYGINDVLYGMYGYYTDPSTLVPYTQINEFYIRCVEYNDNGDFYLDFVHMGYDYGEDYTDVIKFNLSELTPLINQDPYYSNGYILLYPATVEFSIHKNDILFPYEYEFFNTRGTYDYRRPEFRSYDLDRLITFGTINWSNDGINWNFDSFYIDTYECSSGDLIGSFKVDVGDIYAYEPATTTLGLKFPSINLEGDGMVYVFAWSFWAIETKYEKAFALNLNNFVCTSIYTTSADTPDLLNYYNCASIHCDSHYINSIWYTNGANGYDGWSYTTAVGAPPIYTKPPTWLPGQWTRTYIASDHGEYIRDALLQVSSPTWNYFNETNPTMSTFPCILDYPHEDRYYNYFVGWYETNCSPHIHTIFKFDYNIEAFPYIPILTQCSATTIYPLKFDY